MHSYKRTHECILLKKYFLLLFTDHKVCAIYKKLLNIITKQSFEITLYDVIREIYFIRFFYHFTFHFMCKTFQPFNLQYQKSLFKTPFSAVLFSINRLTMGYFTIRWYCFGNKMPLHNVKLLCIEPKMSDKSDQHFCHLSFVNSDEKLVQKCHNNFCYS